MTPPTQTELEELVQRGRGMLALACTELESSRPRALQRLEAAEECFTRGGRTDLVAECVAVQAELLCLIGEPLQAQER